MHTLTLDPWMGASGDMLLGVLLDLGADVSAIEPIEAALDVEYEVSQTSRQGISAIDVSIVTAGSSADRTPPEVIDEIEAIALDATVIEDAIAVVERLGEAEAEVHGESVETVHFHEVGAADAIADICGVAALLDDLEVDSVLTTPVTTGSGTVETAHGTYPIPPPAVTAIAETAGWSIRSGPIEGELLTPTGAALLAEFADGRARIPPVHLEVTGYGAGDRRYPERPNVLRGLLGDVSGELEREDVVLLETIVDDVTGETIGALHESLSEVGALDVAALPATMKHSRPGELIQVVVNEADADAVARALAVETGTLGVREIPVTHRFVAHRTIESVEIEVDGRQFELEVKVATDDEGTLLDVSTEDADARRIARETGMSVREVRRRGEATYHAER